MNHCPTCNAEIDSENPNGRCPQCSSLLLIPTERVNAASNQRLHDSIEPADSPVDVEDYSPTDVANRAPNETMVCDRDDGATETHRSLTLAADTLPRGIEILGSTQTIDYVPQGRGDSSGDDTAIWDPQGTWQQVAQEPAVTAMTSLRAEGPNQLEGQSTLVLRSRRIAKADKAHREETDFQLLDLLGKGGMGMVFSARQASIDRTVAVKMIRPEVANDDQRRNEFLSEACVTGDLEHPNIVPIYELGSTDRGAYFYAMKCVHGTPWKNVLSSKPLVEHLEILMRVSDAVAFAHSRGIVHRDLKPENIMLGDFGEVLVMDWGMAMPIDPLRTFGGIRFKTALGGTPAFMAPEMVLGPVSSVGPHSDIYLLSAMLFQVLTGVPPHAGKSARDTLRAAAANEIVFTDQQGELIQIARKGMATRPADRYASVLDFQRAIREYQTHSESIKVATHAAMHLEAAREEGTYDRYSRAVFGFQEAIALWSENTNAKERLEKAQVEYARTAKSRGDYELGLGLLSRELPEQAALLNEIQAAKDEREAKQRRLQTYKRVGLALAASFFAVVCGSAYWIRLERNEAILQRGEAQKNFLIANKEREQADSQRLLAEEKSILAEQRREAAELAREQERLAKEQEQIAREQERLAKEQERQAKEAEAYEAYVARIGAAAGKIEANAHDHARELLLACVPRTETDQDFRHWEWGRLWFLCEQASQVMREPNSLETLAVQRDAEGRIEKVATGGATNTISIWNSQGNRIETIDTGARIVNALAFSPDGKRLAVGTPDSLASLKREDAFEKPGNSAWERQPAKGILSIEFSRDGRLLLTASRDGTAQIWDAESLQHRGTLHGHRWFVWKAKFCSVDPVGETRIITVSHDGTAIVWTDSTGEWRDKSKIEESPRFDAHRGPVFAAAFSPTASLFATAGQDGRILLWKLGDLRKFDFSKKEAPPPTPFRRLGSHSAAVRDLAFSADGKLLASAGHDHVVRLWDVIGERELKSLRGHGEWVTACGIAADGGTVVSAAHDGTARRWDVGGYEELRVLQGRVLEGHDDAVLAAAFSASADHVVTASRDRTLKTWNADSGQELKSFREGHQFLATQGVFYNQGEQLATAAVDNTVRLWDVATGTQQQVLTETGRGAVVAVSSDGQRLLTGGPSSNAGQRRNGREADDKDAERFFVPKLWELPAGRVLQELTGEHRGLITAVAISPDGKLLFTGDTNGLGVLWNASDGKRIRRLEWHAARIMAAEFSDDSQSLITAGQERVVVRWNLNLGTVDEQSLLKHPADLVAVDLKPSAKRVVTCTRDNVVRIWDTANRRELIKISVDDPTHPHSISRVALAPNQQMILVVNHRLRTLRLYRVEDGKEVEYPESEGQLGPFLKLPESTQLWSAAFAPGSEQVLSIGGDQLRLHELDRDLSAGRRLRLSFSPHGVVASASFSLDGKRVVSGSWDGTANIWDANSGQALVKLIGGHQSRINSARFSPDAESRYVLTAGEDGVAVLWEGSSGTQVRRFEGTGTGLTCASFSNDMTQFVTSGRDGRIRLWDVSQPAAPLRVLGNGSSAVYQAVFSPDGKQIASSGADNTARIWDSETGALLQSLSGHTAGVTSVAWTPDGRRLFTGSDDFSAKVWDPASGKELLTLAAHQREVASVAIASSKPHVLTGSLDGTAMVWRAAPWNTLPKVHTSGYAPPSNSSRDGSSAKNASAETETWRSKRGRFFGRG